MVVPPGSVTFNTVITKLKAGKQIFSNTVIQPDLEAAKKACEGQDFIWIEMQHSTLTWRETQQLIKVVAEAGCIPFVRVPSANVGDILKACDAGALGVVVPMVESVEEARNAVSGGGTKGGFVHGASDRRGAYPSQSPVTASDIVATIYHGLGISSDVEIHDRLNRPILLWIAPFCVESTLGNKKTWARGVAGISR